MSPEQANAAANHARLERLAGLTQSILAVLSGVFSRLPKLLMAAALAGSIGLHWAFFQSVAWVGMVITYSQESTLTDALGKTFDGKHPCALCKQIAKEKKAQKKSDRQLEGKRLEFISTRKPIVLTPPNLFSLQTTVNDSAPQISD